MSALIKPPKTDEEWALRVEQRLRRLANPQTVRVGAWVLFDRDGSLIASRPGEQAVAMAGEAVQAVEVDLSVLSRYVTSAELSTILTGLNAGSLNALVSFLNQMAGGGDLATLISGAAIDEAVALGSQIAKTLQGASGAIQGAITGAGVEIADDLEAAGTAFGAMAKGTDDALRGAITAAGVSITDLEAAATAFGGRLQHLTATGLLEMAGLSPGAFPPGVTLSGSQLTGILNAALTVEGQALGGIQTNLAAALHSLLTVSGDPHFGNVVALLHCDGTNGSTTFIDSSPQDNLFSSINGVVLSTDQSKFGGASASFAATNSFLTLTSNTASLAYGTDDFTIECWIYLNGTMSTTSAIYDSRNSGGNQIFWYVTAGGQVNYVNLAAGAQITSSILSFGQWHHVAVCRKSGTAQMFVNGVSVGTIPDATNYADPGTGLMIGRNAGSGLSLNGYLDEIRITKGVARYTNNLPVPTVAFPSKGVTYGDIGSALNAALTVGGQAIGTVQTNAQGALDAIEGAITGAGVEITDGLEAAGGQLGALTQGASNTAHGFVDSFVQAAKNDAALANQSVADAKAQLVSWISSAPRQLQGLTGVFGVPDFAAALGAHKTNTQATQTQVVSVASALKAEPSPAGTDVTVDFTTMADQPNMSGVMLPGTGALEIADGQAVIQADNSSDFEVFPDIVTSDYVVIEVTLGSLNDLTSSGVLVEFVGRCNSTLDTLVYLALTPYGSSNVVIEIVAVSGGVAHIIGNQVNLTNIAQDGVFKIIMGDRLASNPYVYEVLYNNTVVIGPVTDVSNYSQLGSSQRYVGLVELSTSGKFPPGIKKVRYYDNAPSAGDRPYAQIPPNNADSPGGLYIPSDTGLILRDNGTSWDRVYGGQLSAFTPPPVFSTQTPLGSATLTDDRDGRLLTFPPNDNGAVRGEYDSLPVASGYKCEAYIEHSVHGSGHTVGLLISDGTRFILFGPTYSSAYATANTTAIATRRNTSAATFNAYAGGHSIGYWWGLPNWYRIRDDGVTRHYESSYNGLDWFSIYSESRTTFLTATSIGWGGACSSSDDSLFSRLRSFKIS